MQAQEIKTADDLKAWLETLPPEQGIVAAQHIAHRAALRVLPIWAIDAMNYSGDAAIVSVFAIQLLTELSNSDRQFELDRQVHRRLQTDAFDIYAFTSSQAALALIVTWSDSIRSGQRTLTEMVVGQSDSFYGAAVGVVNYADESLRVQGSDPTEPQSTAATHRILQTRETAIAAAAADAVAIQNGQSLNDRPLWPNGSDPLGDEWAKAKPLFAAHQGWAVFTSFYANALHGRPQDMQTLSALAKQDADFWVGEDDEVLDRIAALTDALTNGAKPNVNSGAIAPRETVVTVDVQSTMVAMVQNRQQLPQTFSAILGFIDLEIDRLQRRNYTSDADRDECQRQIRSLCIIKDAVAGMMPLIPQSPIMPQQDAEKAAGLIQVYANEIIAWPRENVGEIVDNTYRLALIGATAIALPMVGVATPIAAFIGAAIFGGPRLLENAQKAKKLLSGSTG